MLLSEPGVAAPRAGRRATRWLLLAAGMGVYALLAVSSMRLKTATYDEPLYITAGYTHLTRGDYRVNPQTPPLAKTVAAAGLLGAGVRFVEDDPAWRQGYQNKLARQFLYRWNDADRLLFRARLPIVALACLLAAAVYLWTLRLYGAGPAAVALLLCVLNPDVLAHGQLATTDLAAALFVFLTVVAFERLEDGLTPTRVAAAGLGLGAALAAKTSGFVLFPILAVLGLAAAVSHRPLALRLGSTGRPLVSRRSRLLALACILAAMSVVAWGTIWASHGFRASVSRDAGAPPLDWTILPEGHVAGDLLRTARDWRLLPEPYLYGLAFRVASNAPVEDEAPGAFLLGRLSDRGWWYYFPVTFALKTPLPLIALLAVSLALLVRRRGDRARAALLLWMPAVVFTASLMAQRLNLGHRYLLPAYPFLFTAAGAAAWTIGGGASSRARRLLLGGLLAWYAAGTLLLHPHYLAYFNEAAGGPRHGYRHLVDSNLDWGQDLKGLKAWLDRHPGATVKLSYFGMADPEYYGIHAPRLPGFPPPMQTATEVLPGDLVAVSATNLQAVRLHEGRRLMRRLRESQPIDHVGYSILIFQPDFRWSLEQER